MENQSNAEKEYKEIQSLRKGGIVECRECHSGIYEPINGAKPSESHYFACNKCGAVVRFEPVIDFDWRN